nr:MAG TPA: hypothetical protein [Caudoviricetes sp.]
MFAQLRQSADDRIDFGCMVQAGNPLNFLRRGFQTPCQFRFAYVLRQHFIEQQYFRVNRQGQRDQAFAFFGGGRQGRGALVFKVEIHCGLQHVFRHFDRLGHVVALRNGFGNIAEGNDIAAFLGGGKFCGIVHLSTFLQALAGLPLFQTELFFDSFDQARFQLFGRVAGQVRLLALVIQLDVPRTVFGFYALGHQPF